MLFRSLISKEDTTEFADKVDYLLSHEAERKALGIKAKAYVASRWTDKAQALRLVKFYDKLIMD